MGLRKLLLVAGCWLLLAFAASGQTINTTLLTPNAVCQGSTTVVSFTSVGTFDLGNVYTAQLSDIFGSFASPTSIGTLPSTLNGPLTITATIPLATPAGSGYIIRVISSNPPVTNDGGQPLTIKAKPLVTAIPSDQSGPNAVCSGVAFQPIIFSGAAEYNWIRNNTTDLVGIDPTGPGGTTSIDGVFNNLTPITQTSTFTITGLAANGCISIVSASVTVNPPPTVTDIIGPDAVCTGKTITLTDATPSGDWTSSDNTIATVDATGAVTGVVSGNVIITYTVKNGQECVNSVIKSISVNESPTATVTGTTTICAGNVHL